MTKRNVVVLFYPIAWPGKDFRSRVPWGLLYLERMVRDMGVEVVILDENVQHDYEKRVAELAPRILLAGVSSMTGYQIKGGMSFSAYVKRLDPSIPVLWGGWHPTLMPEQTMAEPTIDMVGTGQAEYLFQRLVERMVQGASLEGIPGLWLKRDGVIITPPPREKFTDVKKFPRLNLDLIDFNDYVFENTYAKRCIGYFSSHGCPFDCSFCCVAEVFEKRWYNKEIDEIIDELRHIKKQANIDSVTFDDDNFFVGRSKGMALIEALTNSGLDLKWDTSSHPASFMKTFKDDDIKAIYASGCRQIYCGAESGSDETLILINKKSDVDANYRFVNLLNSHGITPLFSTIIAFPSNPDLDLADTLDMIRRAKLIDRTLRARIFFYTPYPGTPLYELSLKKGLVPPDRLEAWTTYTLRKFTGPWWTRDYRWEVELFANFYFPLANPDYWRMVPLKFRPIAWIINKGFFPIVNYRWVNGDFRWPVEASLFIRALKLFNKLTGHSFCLGFESYLEDAPPLRLGTRFLAWLKSGFSTAKPSSPERTRQVEVEAAALPAADPFRVSATNASAATAEPAMRKM